MNKLTYSHQAVKSLAWAGTAWLYGVIAGRLNRTVRAGLRCLPWRRLLLVVAVVFTLVIEAVMLYTLAQLIDLCISLMEVWAELAAKHLQITLEVKKGDL